MNEIKTSNKPLNLSDFKLIRAHFESRSVPRYLQWDRAGAIWTEMLVREPNLKLLEGDPAKTAFSLDRKYELSIYLTNTGTDTHHTIRGTAHQPQQSLKDFNQLLKIFVDIAVRYLEIAEFSRLGLRLVYTKNFSDLKTASQAFLSTNLIKIPSGPHFGLDGSPILPEYCIRLEDEKKGVTIRLKVEGMKMEFAPPPDWDEVEPFVTEKNELVFDIDYYTFASVSVGKFSIEDWITQGLHVINRDSGKFLGGE